MIPVERIATVADTYPPFHGGAGSVASRIYFEGRNYFPLEFDMDVMPPGASEGMHVHDHTDATYGPMAEMYLVISGLARVIVDGETADLGPGDAAVAEAGTSHDLVNIGEGPLSVLTMYLPPINRRVTPAE